jgi:pyridoxal phosphate enzyme (YggS family)
MLAENISGLKQEIGQNVQLVIVSKYRQIKDIKAAYDTGHRVFAENRVQSLLERYDTLPRDIQWHLIGHLQTNKVKYIAPFITCIQSVDSINLLSEINKYAAKNNRIIDCLLQIYIASEDTKFGLSEAECNELLQSEEFKVMNNIRIRGLMGMASNADDVKQVEREFLSLQSFYHAVASNYTFEQFDTLSMGMSGDYNLAIQCGSNMIRVGSKVFE